MVQSEEISRLRALKERLLTTDWRSWLRGASASFNRTMSSEDFYWFQNSRRHHRFLVILAVIAAVSLLPSLSDFHLEDNETKRLSTSYEMTLTGDYFRPAYLGVAVYNKPPLFNWLVILNSKLIGWNNATARMLALLATVGTALLTGMLAFRLSRDKTVSYLSSLLYISSGGILWCFGWRGEIDPVLVFFSTLMLSLQAGAFLFKHNKSIYFAGFLAGVLFLFVGFNAYLFFGLTYLAFGLAMRQGSCLGSRPYLLSYLLSLLAPAAWLAIAGSPALYLKALAAETFFHGSYFEGGAALYLGDFLDFLFDTFKQLFPASLVVIALLIKQRITLSPFLRCLLFVGVINYLPYLVSAFINPSTVHSIYLIPLIPPFAIVLSYLFVEFAEPIFLNSLYVLALCSVSLRFIFGALGVPLIMAFHHPARDTAQDFLRIAPDPKAVACDCPGGARQCRPAEVCLYYSLISNTAVPSSAIAQDRPYLISSEKYPQWEKLKEFKDRRKRVRLYKKGPGHATDS